MMKKNFWIKDKTGISLIELLVTLVVSTILVAGSYKVFIGQQKTYQVQEQVVEMQQNARFALERMLREIRMAGFGNVASLLPLSAANGPFQNIINPIDNNNLVNENDDQITIVGAFEQISTLAQAANQGTNTLILSGNGAAFNPASNNRYICIGGIESRIVTSVNSNTITLNNTLGFSHGVGTPVYKVKAITYRLGWDAVDPTMPVLIREDNTDGGGPQVVAEHIKNLQFRYILEDGTETNSPGIPGDIRVIGVNVLAKTDMADPDYKDESGYRTRQIVSNIQLRNMALSP